MKDFSSTVRCDDDVEEIVVKFEDGRSDRVAYDLLNNKVDANAIYDPNTIVKVVITDNESSFNIDELKAL